MLKRCCVLFSLLAACGGATPTPVTPPNTTQPTTTPATTPTEVPPPVGVSVVRFDDLGVSFAVPAGYHVMGDDDLSARIRASANPRLTAALQSRASQKKAVPLLTLSKEADKNESLTITITAAVVPFDATPAELLAQQQSVMKENLDGFTVIDGPTDRAQDGVAGIVLVDHYRLRNAQEARKMASTMRLYVRAGLAISIVAVWPETAPAGHLEEAQTLLDGLHFYAAQP
jgi:hypothetical protein